MDILVNNAGISPPVTGAFCDTTPALWDKIMEANLRGPFFLTAAIAKQMIARGKGGSIVNISTTSARMAQPEIGAYCVSKAALDAMTRVFARAEASSYTTGETMQVNGGGAELSERGTEKTNMYVPDSFRFLHRMRPLPWLAVIFLLPAELDAQGRQAAPAARLQTIEAEALLDSVRGVRGVSAQRMEGFGDGWSGGAQLLWSGAAPGAVLDIAFDVDQPAVYAVELYFTRAPDYAQITFAIDHKESKAFLDTYGPRVAPPIPYQAGSFPLAAGTHTLSLRVDSKHAQSGGYLVGLDRIRLYPTAALATDTRGSAPAVRAAALPASATGAARAAASEQGGDCASSCMGSVSTVYRKNTEGQCLAWFRVPCDPYGCDAKSGTCRSTCTSDAQCGQGSKCNTNTGMCTSAPPACADAVTVRSANGQTESCLPYKCRAGVCRESCDSSNDCSTGYGCNAYGRCAKKP